MMWIFWLFFGGLMLCLLGLSINAGVAAERLKLAGRTRDQWIAVALSAALGIGALYFAYLIGQSANG